MTALKLNDELSSAIECYENRARLIVYKNGQENVCRKETFSNLNYFTLAGNGRIFKGRLQLNKDGENIGIEVKGILAGVIRIDDFLDCMRKAQNYHQSLEAI